jgi:hypothetical protein
MRAMCLFVYAYLTIYVMLAYLTIYVMLAYLTIYVTLAYTHMRYVSMCLRIP